MGHDGESGGDVYIWGADEEIFCDELGEVFVGDSSAGWRLDGNVSAEDEDVACAGGCKWGLLREKGDGQMAMKEHGLQRV